MSSSCSVKSNKSNMACILAYHFNSAFRQHCEVWPSQFPLHHSIKDSIPCNEALLYHSISWSLTQAHQQSSLWFSQSSTCMMSTRSSPKGIIHGIIYFIFRTVLEHGWHNCLYHLKAFSRCSNWLMLCCWGNLLQSIMFVLFGQDHLLCQWTCRPLLVVQCYSEQQSEWLPLTHPVISFFSCFSAITMLV